MRSTPLIIDLMTEIVLQNYNQLEEEELCWLGNKIELQSRICGYIPGYVAEMLHKF